MSKLVENYLLQEPIGKGVYGQVYRAIHQKSKQEYAVKAIPKSSFKANPKLEQLAINQINILSTLKHQNIVRFIQTLKTPNNFYFVYEYCNSGTLESLLQKRKHLSQQQSLVIFRQLLEAFKQLNKNNIMHRDLKPDNIFFSDGKVKLGDFGFCKMLEVNMAQTILGSPIYMAPQILKEEIYTLKADIWSLGVVLFEMIFGFCPYESSSISQLIDLIKDTELVFPKRITPISSDCETLIRKMLVKDQFKRIEWVDLFDYRIDDQGHITSGYKKDLGIQVLEKYFLLDVKGEIDYSVKPKEEGAFPPTKEGIESNKAISNKESIENSKTASIKQGSQITKITNNKESIQNNNTISIQNNNILSLQSNNILSIQSNRILSKKDGIYSKEKVNSPSNQDINQSGKATTSKDGVEHNPILKKTVSEQPSHWQGLSSKENKPNYIKQPQNFIDRHARWLKGIMLLDELSEKQPEWAEPLFVCLLAGMMREISQQYQMHPEWTDVLLEQKRCVSEALHRFNKDELKCDPASIKRQIESIWGRSEESNKGMCRRVIKYIFKAENEESQVQVLLAGQ